MAADDLGRREHKLTGDWVKVCDEAGQLYVELACRTEAWVGLSNDPKTIAVLLFKRAHGHHKAFSLLWCERLFLDADNALRSALEAAICLANLAVRRDAFVEDLRSDAAKTTRGQVPIWFEADPELGKEASLGLAEIFGSVRSDGQKHDKLEMKVLAADAALPQLYHAYKHLSGTSVHITGLSILTSIESVDDEEHVERLDLLRRMGRFQALTGLCGASVICCEAFARIHEFTDLAAVAHALMKRMSDLSDEQLFEDAAGQV
jgi:hypothetical protein